MKIITSILLSFILASCTTSKYTQFIHTSTPKNIDKKNRYLFFMHGKIVEKKGLPASSRKYGYYAYQDMLDTFASKGFIVISEPRRSGTDIYNYAIKVSEQVKQLIKVGVPPTNITVSGFSKGGRISMVVSSLLNNKEINYVVLAGCRASDIGFYNLTPTGRVLSIYDSNDDMFGSCSNIFSAGKDNLHSNEIVLNIGDGHGVFYQPMAEWIDPMINWAKK